MVTTDLDQNSRSPGGTEVSEVDMVYRGFSSSLCRPPQGPVTD